MPSIISRLNTDLQLGCTDFPCFFLPQVSQRILNSQELPDSCLHSMTAELTAETFFCSIQSLASFSDKMKDSGTLLCRKAGKAVQCIRLDNQNISGHLTCDIRKRKGGYKAQFNQNSGQAYDKKFSQ